MNKSENSSAKQVRTIEEGMLEVDVTEFTEFSGFLTFIKKEKYAFMQSGGEAIILVQPEKGLVLRFPRNNFFGKENMQALLKAVAPGGRPSLGQWWDYMLEKLNAAILPKSRFNQPGEPIHDEMVERTAAHNAEFLRDDPHHKVLPVNRVFSLNGYIFGLQFKLLDLAPFNWGEAEEVADAITQALTGDSNIGNIRKVKGKEKEGEKYLMEVRHFIPTDMVRRPRK